MSRTIYDMLNEVETNIDGYEEEAMSELEQKRVKKNLHAALKSSSYKEKRKGSRKKVAAVVTAAALVAVVGLSAGPFQPIVQAAVKAISYDIASLLGIQEDLDPYKVVIGKSVTKNGITITLNEVILDDGVMYVSSTQKYDKATKIEDVNLIMASIYANGREISYGAGGGLSQEDEYTFVDMSHYNITDVPMNETQDFEIQFRDENSFSSSWSFSFSASGEELAQSTNKVEINKSFTLEDNTVVNLLRLNDNAVGQRIHFTTSTEFCNYDLMITGRDNLGNPVEFNLSTFSGGNGVLELSTINNGNLSNEATELYLTLYAVKFPEESGRLSNDFKQVGEEFRIKIK